MSHSSSVFSRVPIELPNRSGFDCSHENLGTMTCGTLVPVLVDELLPNDTISLGAAFQVQLPPIASDFYGRIDYVLEAFFVPNRLLWGGWESFMTHPTANPQYPVGTPVQGKSKYMPWIVAASNGDNGVYGIFNDIFSGSLADFLGAKSVTLGQNTEVMYNALPFLAYHRIWDDWYRDSRIQAPLFYRPDSTTFNADSDTFMYYSASHMPFVSGGVDVPNIITHTSFSDGVFPTELRQRNFAKDYFTTSSTLPQAGNAATVDFDVTDNQGTFSIATLRAANSLQKWMERNNLAGYRYSDQIYAQYGIYPSDAIMDRCIYLGRHTQNVYTRSVFQTNPNPSGEGVFNSVGSKYGSSQAVGQGSLVDKIRVTEHGFLIVLASLVPHAYYSSGTRRYLSRAVVGDIAFPLLSGMGDQAIYKYELDSTYYPGSPFPVINPPSSDGPGGGPEIFGYTDMYAEYKYHDDEVHGLLRDGENLESFALQRSFDSPELGSDFLQIPKDFLKQVFATSNEVSGFDCWYDIYFPYKKVSTLPEYSLPTLADLKHVHTKYISRGGKRL